MRSAYELVAKEDDEAMRLPTLRSDLPAPSPYERKFGWLKLSASLFIASALLLIVVRLSPEEPWRRVKATIYDASASANTPSMVEAPRQTGGNATTSRRLSTYNGLRYPDIAELLIPTMLDQHPMPSCSLESSAFARFAPLSRGQGPILLAMNLYQSEAVLHTFLRELPILIAFLGPQRLHISVYENGSTDRTVALLRHLAWQLHQLGASFTVHSVGDVEESHKESGHRIHVLAALRNKLLLPLSDPEVAGPGGRFETVLFMNDIQFCVSDVLEVLLQRKMQAAHLACAIDWNRDPPVFYDQWVTRDVEGYTFYNKQEWDASLTPQPFPRLPETRQRYDDLLPIPMTSCWNGIAVFSAEAFLPPHALAFRTSEDTSKHSECLLMSLDLWKAGLGRILMTPRANVAYSVEEYELAQRRVPPLPADGVETGAWSERERVTFPEAPPEEILVYEDGWWGSGQWVPIFSI